jgi:undecaprenyl-phosphate 4-deoxy-4-formamido-L-arabinose transferase
VPAIAHPYEIVLVDDGSRDDLGAYSGRRRLRPGSPVVAVILNRNYGQHAAIMAGFEQCKGDVVITLDADLQNPPEEIPRLVAQAAWAMTWSPPCATTVRTRPCAAGHRA